MKLKGITLGENSDKALTDTSKFVFGLTFRHSWTYSEQLASST